jgi:hypothetical protein
MGCTVGSYAGLADLRRRKEYASVCVPPWRPDLRPETPDPGDAWPTFAQVLRGLFRGTRGPAHRGLKPEPVGR